MGPQSQTAKIPLCSAWISPWRKRVQAYLSICHRKILCFFSSPLITSSISVARSLLSEKENLLQTPMLPDLQRGFGAGCCTGTHIKAGSLPPAPSPEQGEARPGLRISVKASKQLCWGKMGSIWELALQNLGDKRGSEKTGCSCHKHDNRQKLGWTAEPFKCA